MYRVVIVEDDPMVSLLNRTFVERDARFQVVQSFQDGRAALAWLEQNPADLAVLDVYMPLFTGLDIGIAIFFLEKRYFYEPETDGIFCSHCK